MKEKPVKKETKKPLTVLVKPSNKERAKKKAAKQCRSLSEVVDTLLYDYSVE